MQYELVEIFLNFEVSHGHGIIMHASKRVQAYPNDKKQARNWPKTSQNLANL